MKKLITGLAFIFAIGYAQAQTDTTRTQFEYYPDANVYYNDVAKTYWYHDSTSNQWQSGAELPSSYSVNDKSRKNSFYYNGGDVWKDNDKHLKMYGSKNRTKKSGTQKSQSTQGSQSNPPNNQ